MISIVSFSGSRCQFSILLVSVFDVLEPFILAVVSCAGTSSHILVQSYDYMTNIQSVEVYF